MILSKRIIPCGEEHWDVVLNDDYTWIHHYRTYRDAQYSEFGLPYQQFPTFSEPKLRYIDYMTPSL